MQPVNLQQLRGWMQRFSKNSFYFCGFVVKQRMTPIRADGPLHLVRNLSARIRVILELAPAVSQVAAENEHSEYDPDCALDEIERVITDGVQRSLPGVERPPGRR